MPKNGITMVELMEVSIRRHVDSFDYIYCSVIARYQDVEYFYTLIIIFLCPFFVAAFCAVIGGRPKFVYILQILDTIIATSIFEILLGKLQITLFCLTFKLK